MTESEFYNSISTLEAAFIGRIPKGFDDARSKWFKELRWASKGTLNKAISDLIKLDRFPVLGQVLAACNEHVPQKSDGFYLNKKFCYRHIQSEQMQCGCVECHPDFWCRHDDCQWPVAARMQPTARVPRSTEFCIEHFDREPVI